MCSDLVFSSHVKSVHIILSMELPTHSSPNSTSEANDTATIAHHFVAASLESGCYLHHGISSHGLTFFVWSSFN